MSQFAYLVRPAFDQAFMDAAAQEALEVVDRHWEFLLELHAAGRLSFAGRCCDGPFGIVVFDAESEAAARALMESDPSVRSGIQTAELHPFKIGLVGGVAA